MILKVDNLSAKEFASLSAFLASEQNVLKEHLHEDGSRVLIDSQYPNASHFADLRTSKGSDGIHNVVLELQEYWTSVDNSKIRLSMESHPLPVHYLLNLMRAMGRYTE